MLKTRTIHPRLILGSMACLLTFSVCGSFGAFGSSPCNHQKTKPSLPEGAPLPDVEIPADDTITAEDAYHSAIKNDRAEILDEATESYERAINALRRSKGTYDRKLAEKIVTSYAVLLREHRDPGKASALEREFLPDQPRKMDLDALLTQKSDLEFSADVWKTSLGKRKELLYSLVHKLPMIGMNRSEIHAFLGNPEFVDQGWEFFLIEPKSADNLLLEIAYTGNRVIAYRIIPKARIDRPETAQTSPRTSRWRQYVLGIDDPLFRDLKKRQESESLLLRQATALQAAGKNQEALDLAEKTIDQYPTDNTTELRVSLLQKLGRPQEALVALGEDPVNPYNQIPYMEKKIAILTELQKYKVALQTCDCLSVGSVDGKPYGLSVDGSWRRAPGATPYLLRSRILLREGKTSQAREEAEKAFYLRNYSNRHSSEITDLLKELREKPDESITSNRVGNKKVLQVLAKLIRASNFSKADLESLFERKFFRLYQISSDSDNEFNSCDGTSLFTDVIYGVDHNDSHERYLSVRFNPLLVYLTQKDLESVIGKGMFHPGGGNGCVFTPAVLRFELPDRTLTFEPGIGDDRPFLSVGIHFRKEGTEARLP